MTPFGKRDERISRTEQNRFRKFPFSAHRNELFSLPRSEKPDTRIRAFHPWGISTGHAGVCLNQTSSPTRAGPDSGCEAAATFKFPRAQEPFHPTSPPARPSEISRARREAPSALVRGAAFTSCPLRGSRISARRNADGRIFSTHASPRAGLLSTVQGFPCRKGDGCAVSS